MSASSFPPPGPPPPSPGRVAPSSGKRPGKLVIVGSGIKSIAHMTLEAISHIQAANKVFYVIADPATETYIEKLNPTAVDLYKLYDDGKPRHQTYVQMAEILLREVRQGFYVVGCFYGHPGVFANPPHRAVSIARNEGHEAVMLPGISAEDCLFADLNIDPSRPGCQTVGATDIVLRNKSLALDCHVIIFQVGAVGEQGFNFKGFERTKFPALVNVLLRFYGPKHKVVHYVASTLSIASPKHDEYTIGDLKKPKVAAKITGISTFYLPPKVSAPPSKTGAQALALKVNTDKSVGYGAFAVGNPYGARELAAIKALDNYVVPKNYRKTRTSPEMYEALSKLALDPKAVVKYNASPKRFAASYPDLTPAESSALVKGHSGSLRMVLKADATDVAKQFVQAEIRNPSLANQYATICKQNQNQSNGNDNIAAWLKSQGYDTTVNDVWTAYQAMLNQDLDVYDSQYVTQLNGATGPVVTIQDNTIYVAGTAIQKPSYASNTLSWNASDGNASTATLHFQLLTADDGKPLPAGAYVGPQFFGIFSTPGQATVTASNFFGKVGSVPGPSPATSSQISTWFATYTTYIKDSSGTFQKDSTMIVADAGSGKASVTYKGVTIKNSTYSNETLSWTMKDSNSQYVSISFYMNKPPTEKNPTAGPQFSGKLWTVDGQTPAQPNFWGQVGSSANPTTASSGASSASFYKTLGINLAVGAGSMVLGNLANMAINKFIEWYKSPTPANKAALDQANADANEGAAEQQAVGDQAAEADVAAEGEPAPAPPAPPEPPQEFVEEEEEFEEEFVEEEEEEQNEEVDQEQQIEEEEEVAEEVVAEELVEEMLIL